LHEFKAAVRDGRDIFMVGEANGVAADELDRWVGDDGVFDMLFEFSHTHVPMGEAEIWCRTTTWKLADLKRALAASQRATAANGWYPAFFENHDQPRSTVNFFQCDGPLADKAKVLGAVPLTTSVVTNYASLYDYDRSPVDKVYAQIDADVARAVELLPQQIKNASETGRATSIAALALQGKALLTQGEYSGAESALKRIIDFSQANPDLLGLEDDPSQIYASDNAIGKEVIFAAQFNNGSTVINNPLMKATIPAGVPQSQPSYVYPDGTASTIKTSVGNSTLLMTWELFNALRADKADKRYQQLSYNGIYDNGSLSRQTDEVDTTPEGYAYMPITLKYYDFANQGLTTDRSSNDNIIFRYADVLLEYAEVLNSTGRADEALAYLNQVRRRAGVADVAGTEQLALAIENERLLELNFEGHRWFDLVRTGRITSVMEAHFAHRTQGLSTTLQVSDNGLTVENEQSVSGTPVKWKWSGQQTAVLFPIPYSQIQLNPNWQQNDLY
jgi:tetratricopeptide (TPR) repeat protein